MYSKSQNNLKACLRKLNYQQQTRLSTTRQNIGIHKINLKEKPRGVILST